MSRTCILLVNWNGWGDTLECLESIFRNVPVDTQVIVCDNNSTDGSLEKIKAWAEGRLDVLVPVGHPLRTLSWPPVNKPIRCRVYDRLEAEKGGKEDEIGRLTLIRTGGNLGFAGGNNVGLRYVLARGDCDYVWLLNNDTVVAPEALTALVRRMAARPSAGMCGSTLLYYDSPARIQAQGGGYYCKWIGLPWHLGRLQKADDQPDKAQVEKWMNYVIGASLMVSREFLETIGPMCEDYFLYFEETDWALRARGRFDLAYAPESRVYHKVGRSIGTSSDPRRKSPTCDFFAVRNRLLFTRRFFPEALPTIYLSVLAALFVRILLGNWGRARMIAGLIFTSKGKLG